MKDSTAPTHDMRTGDVGHVVLINTFYPKPGKLGEFLEMQAAEARRLGDAARAIGWRGNRILCAHGSQTAIIITAFASAAAQKRWAESDLFADHLTRIRPLLEWVESNAYDLVFESGTI